MFDFKLSTDAVFGLNCYRGLPGLIEERGWRRPGLVIDGALLDSAAGGDLCERLAAAFGEIQMLAARSDSEPDYDYLDRSADRLRGRGLDCLIGVGGGSTLDLCKGIGVLLTNPGKGLDYRGMDRVSRPALPAVLIPSTAGTGSEVTFTAVFIDRCNKTKLGINGRNVSARLALLDPALTASAPHRVAVGAGLDAMVHALEAFMTTRHHPIIFELAQQAWSHLFRAFVEAVNEPEADGARLQMLVGSYLAGITLRYSGGGVDGALSYPLGGEFGVPHGLAGGVLLRHLIGENIERGYLGYAQLERRLFPEQATLDPGDLSRRFLARFDELLAAIRSPRDLRGYPVVRGDIARIINLTMQQRGAVVQNNPVPVDAGFLRVILEAVIPA